MNRLIFIIVLSVLSLSCFAKRVNAHQLQPAYLDISEQGEGQFSVLWKRPYVGGRPMNIYPQLPSICRNLTEPAVQLLPTGAVERWKRRL